MNEKVIFANHIHFEPIVALKSVPHIPQIGHEKATAGYERLTRFGPPFGYTHSVFQFTLSGRGYFSSPQGSYELPPGTGFLCSYSDPEVRYWTEDDASENPWEFVFVNFDGGNSREIVNEIIERYGPVFTLPLKLPLIKELVALTAEPITTRVSSPMETATMVYNILSVLFESKTLYGLPETHFLISEAFKIISRETGSCITVKELAERLHVSREHLTRLFAENFGKTPHDCIILEKIKQACHLLKTTNMTNDEVASALGYSMTSRLVLHFKNLLGVTPRQYRQALLSGNDMAYRLFYGKETPAPDNVKVYK